MLQRPTLCGPRLLPDWKLANTLAGNGVDRIGESRYHARRARLTDAARRFRALYGRIPAPPDRGAHRILPGGGETYRHHRHARILNHGAGMEARVASVMARAAAESGRGPTPKYHGRSTQSGALWSEGAAG